MDLEQILNTIQPFIVMFVALTTAFLTAIWISAVIWAFRDIRSRTRDIFAQVLATLMVLIFFPLFPLPGMILYLILRPRETLAEIYERTLEEEALLQGIEERLACPTCNRRIEEDYVVCPACHTRLKKGCTSCGRLLHLSWTICAYCGAAQTTTQTVIPPQPVAMSVEPPAEAPALPEPEGDAEVEAKAEGEAEPMAGADVATLEPGSEPEATDEADALAGADIATLEQEVEPEPEADVEVGPDPEEEDEPDLVAEPDQAPEPETGPASEIEKILPESA